MKVNVLGTDYEINRYNYNELDVFAKKGIDGYCDGYAKEIAICRIKTYPGFENDPEETHKRIEAITLRHELVHAFLNESGLCDSAGQPIGAWSKNEEMVDWIALQFPKILKAFRETDCI